MKKTFYIFIGIIIFVALGTSIWLYYKNFYKNSTYGNITGNLGYPSHGNPAQQICAVNTQNSSFKFCLDTKGGQDKFNLRAPEGEYYVYASLKEQTGDVSPTYRAYYNQFVLCDLNVICDDEFHHQALIPVKVENGKTVKNVNPSDWYDEKKLREIKNNSKE